MSTNALELEPPKPREPVSGPQALKALRAVFKNACRRAIYWSGAIVPGHKTYSIGPRRWRSTANKFNVAMDEARDAATSIMKLTGQRPPLPPALRSIKTSDKQLMLRLKLPPANVPSAPEQPSGRRRRAKKGH